MSQPPRQEGTLKKWNDTRGFGFIAAHGDGDGDAEIFVHITAFPDDGYLPTVGEVLTFEVEPDGNGRPRAVRVQRFADPAAVVAKAGRRGKKLRMVKGSSGHAPSSRRQKLIVLVMLAALAVFAYSRYVKRVGQMEAAAHRTV